jgi:hypothetical protein
MRWLVVPSGIFLSGCSIGLDDIKPLPYIAPSPPSATAQIEGIRKAAKDEGLAGSVEVSDVRASDRGLGRYIICIAGRRGSETIAYFSAFFDNDDYKGVRLSVIYDFCEQQSYRPF